MTQKLKNASGRRLMRNWNIQDNFKKDFKQFLMNNKFFRVPPLPDALISDTEITVQIHKLFLVENPRTHPTQGTLEIKIAQNSQVLNKLPSSLLLLIPSYPSFTITLVCINFAPHSFDLQKNYPRHNNAD